MVEMNLKTDEVYIDVKSDKVREQITKLLNQIKQEKEESNEEIHKRFTLDYILNTEHGGKRIIFGGFDMMGQNIVLKDDPENALLRKMIPTDSDPKNFFILGENFFRIDVDFVTKFRWSRRPAVVVISKDFLDSLSEEEYFDMGKNLGLDLETFDEFGNLIAYTSIFEGELRKDTKDENKSRETSNQNAMDVFDLIKSSLDKGEKIKTAFFKLQAVGFVPFAFIDNIGMNLKSGNHLLKPFMNKNNEKKVKETYVVTDDYEWLQKSKNIKPAKGEGNGHWSYSRDCYVFMRKETVMAYMEKFDIDSLELFNEILHLNFILKDDLYYAVSKSYVWVAD